MLMKELLSIIQEDKKSSLKYTIIDILENLDSELPRPAKYKSINVDIDKKVVTWLTQEGDAADNEEVAADIIAALSKKNITGWTAKVVTRDYYYGDKDTDNTVWYTKQN